MLMKQSLEESQRHAREAEELRASMMEQQMQMQADLARKAQEERRGMLEADSESWVKVLLMETRREAEAMMTAGASQTRPSSVFLPSTAAVVLLLLSLPACENGNINCKWVQTWESCSHLLDQFPQSLNNKHTNTATKAHNGPTGT